jgi:hypothetical protein
MRKPLINRVAAVAATAIAAVELVYSYNRTKKGRPVAALGKKLFPGYASITATISSVRGFTTTIWSFTRMNS